MVRNPELLQKFEDEFKRNIKMTIQEKFDMLDSLYEIAHSTGNLSLKDTLGNLDALIKTTKIFRDASKTPG